MIYSNTFDAPWHLDDYQNITHNPHIRIHNLGINSLAESTTHYLNTEKIQRPFAYLTFAVNWYFGKNDPTGYHFVNIGIHLITAFILFLTISIIFQTPRLKGRFNPEQIHFISLLAAVLWAVNPIQTQAVTYIVQRMASMAAMFYISSLFLYVYGRLSSDYRKKILFFSGCVLSFLFGFASKENAITLPIAILVLEATFFQDLSRKRTRYILTGISIAGFIVIVVLGSFLFLKGDPLNALNYSTRYFTPIERLLTEARIIIFYLSQIFYPAATRLSIEHDVIISTSMLHPWTTLPSIVIILALICLAIVRMKRWPILSFSILFFFLNHIIESSIIGLELIFEHRNFLPSLFLFFPVSVGVKWLLDYYRNKKRWMYLFLIGFVSLMIAGFGISTYVRNITWTSVKFLWEDAMKKAPESSRPLHNLAWAYYERIGEDDKALELYQRALNLGKNNIFQEALILNNIAGLYFDKAEYENAVKYWEEAIESYPNYSLSHYRLAVTLDRLGRYEQALENLDTFVSKNPRYLDALNLKGIILLKQEEYTEALAYFKKCLKLQPRHKTALINTGAAFSLLGDHSKAELFFKTAYYQNQNDFNVLLWLIKTYLHKGDSIQSKNYLNKLFSITPVNTLISRLRNLSIDGFYMENGIIYPALDELLIEKIGLSLRTTYAEIDGLPLFLQNSEK